MPNRHAVTTQAERAISDAQRPIAAICNGHAISDGLSRAIDIASALIDI